ncbi:MAG: hypothetical protein K8R23_07825 [Chthoniobacter sp.]|nr:hypothetical protein [Chthoniobacter sp.]
MCRFVKWAAVLALFTGCREKVAPAPTLADLHFPVAVIFQKGSVALYSDAAALGTMSIGQLNAVTEPPPLIDSSFAIYRLAKLRSTHNDLWLMANPTGITPVSFTLERLGPSGMDAARELLRARLDAQTWRTDLDEKRRALAAEQTLTGMAGVVRSE